MKRRLKLTVTRIRRTVSAGDEVVIETHANPDTGIDRPEEVLKEADALPEFARKIAGLLKATIARDS